MLFARRIVQRISIVRSLLIFIPFLPSVILAQEAGLPKEISGYKIHHAKILLSTAASTSKPTDADARIKFGEPRLIDASLSGISFEVTVEANPANSAGMIDFLAFDNFQVNGIPVRIEEFNGPVSFKKGELFPLPRPVKLFVSSGGILKAAWNEFRNSQNEWLVTGRVLVFGKFRKMGRSFKRFVPVDIHMPIKNPLRRNK